MIEQEQFESIADVIRAVADVLRSTAGSETEVRFI